MMPPDLRVRSMRRRTLHVLAAASCIGLSVAGGAAAKYPAAPISA